MIQDLFKDYGIRLNQMQVHKFKKYYDLLIQENSKINLTTITEYEDVIKKHFLDSCLILKDIPFSYFENKVVLDLGTGAGFPGIPLAIMLSDTSFTLVDSLNKRIEFLKLIVDMLELTNVKLIHDRAEDLGKDNKYREQFDICISRAVAALPLLLEYCSPFVKVKGNLFLYKSKKVTEEIEKAENAFHVLNCNIEKILNPADESDYERYILEIVKSDFTPEKYPRKAGKPKKNPL